MKYLQGTGDIAISLRTFSKGFWLQVAGTAFLAKAFTRPATKATVVICPDVDGQADKDEQDTFEGNWIELHELNG
jgi:hypothetical protein